MIKLHDLYTQTRLAAGDMGKKTYSDFEIKTAADSAISMFEEACIGNFSDVLIRAAVIALVDGAGKLPEGFLGIERVSTEEFSIRGGYIYCDIDDEEVKIIYHQSPERNDTEIDLPRNILFPLARLAANILKEEFEAAAERAKALALNTKSRATGALPDPGMWGA